LKATRSKRKPARVSYLAWVAEQFEATAPGLWPNLTEAERDQLVAEFTAKETALRVYEDALVRFRTTASRLDAIVQDRHRIAAIGTFKEAFKQEPLETRQPCHHCGRPREAGKLCDNAQCIGSTPDIKPQAKPAFKDKSANSFGQRCPKCDAVLPESGHCSSVLCQSDK
jgi:hypothetical protein